MTVKITKVKHWAELPEFAVTVDSGAGFRLSWEDAQAGYRWQVLADSPGVYRVRRILNASGAMGFPLDGPSIESTVFRSFDAKAHAWLVAVLDEVPQALFDKALSDRVLHERMEEAKQRGAKVRRLRQEAAGLGFRLVASPETDFTLLWEDVAAWSEQTFGPDYLRGPLGPIRHLRLEVDEMEADPTSLEEYADGLMVLMDAARRAGFKSTDLLRKARRKLAENHEREWPDWREMDRDAVIEHKREGED